MNVTTNAITSSARRERLSRLGILEEPMGYVEGQNLYQFVGSDPVGSLDPMGLQSAPASQPSNVTLVPIQFPGDVPLPGPFDTVNIQDPDGFYAWYIKGLNRGSTAKKGTWEPMVDGTFQFRGEVFTPIMKRLVLPANLPECVNRDALQKAVSAFNDRARQHELMAQM